MSQYRRRTSEAVLKEIERLRRAQHKIFVGAAAGVGKTYTMLTEAHSLMEAGIDVVAGIIDTHGRHDTEELLKGIEVIPPREVPYKGILLSDLDVDAVLERQPDVVLVDELAHTNAPGSPHAKRYEDVEQILEAGINVHSTLNIQHLESLNDIVARVTGIRVRETVPDSVLAEATELRLIDLAPDALVERFRQGKIYPAATTQKALESFFRVGNLTALRELALRAIADETEKNLDLYMTSHRIEGNWPTKERVLVCVTPTPSGPVLIRRGYRMAQRLNADFYVATVKKPGHTPSSREAQTLDLNLRLARELGAEILEAEDNDVARRLVAIANEVRATQIVLGESGRASWGDRLKGSLIERVLRETKQADVLIVASRPEG